MLKIMALPPRAFALAVLALSACVFDRSGLAPADAQISDLPVDRPAALDRQTDVADHSIAVDGALDGATPELPQIVDGATPDLPWIDGPLPDQTPKPDLPPAPDLPLAPDLPAVPDLPPMPDLPPVADLPPVPDLPLQPDSPPTPLDTDGDGIPDVDDPCPATPNPLLLDETFNTGSGWVDYSGSWSINSGDWLQSQLQDSTSAQHLYRGSFNVTDVYIELSASFVQTTGSGASQFVAVGARTTLTAFSKSYHLCGINHPGGYDIWAMSRAGSTTWGPYTTATPSQGNGPYAIRFSLKGSSAKCWVAGQPANAANFTASNPASGTVELVTQRARGRFHDIRVYGIPALCN